MPAGSEAGVVGVIHRKRAKPGDYNILCCVTCMYIVGPVDQRTREQKLLGKKLFEEQIFLSIANG